MSYATIEARELADKMRAGGSIELIDVRTPAEFREVHATGARNVPLDTLDPASVVNSRNGTADGPLYVLCRSGSRAAQACKKFQAAGYTTAVTVVGGTLGWEQAGLPVVRGKKAVSLERQVRIVAGFLVLVGSVLGLFVHPWFIGLSAVIGAGLLFAGITDTCGMGMMLAKMPWNQASDTNAPPTACSIG